ncbi:cystein rich protein [Fusarium avenaceum]|nr:cystein rich protein [Fusarium avenaceum]
MIFMPYKSIIIIIQAWSTLSSFRLDRIQSNVETVIIDGRAHIDLQREEIVSSEASSGIEDIFRCAAKAGKKLQLSDDQKFAACCPPGRKLMGSTDTEFDCCTSDQMLGYDGSDCKDQHLQRRLDNTERSESDSKLIEGLCYRIASGDGASLAVNDNGLYSASPNSQARRFQLCKSEACDSGQPINANDMIRIKDTQNQKNGRHNGNQWLDDGSRNSQIAKTDILRNAGIFSLSSVQSLPEHYCIGGANQGIDWINDKQEALSFKPQDKASCIRFRITQVACDGPPSGQECPLRDILGRCIDNVGMNIIGPGVVVFPANFLSADGPRLDEVPRSQYWSSSQYQDVPSPDKETSFSMGPITAGAGRGGSAGVGAGNSNSAIAGDGIGGNAVGNGCCRN